MKSIWLFVAAVMPMAAQDVVSAEQAMERAKQEEAIARQDMERAKLELALMQPPAPGKPPAPPAPPADIWMHNEDAYFAGKHMLEKREWDRAVRYFDRVIEGKKERTDAALYWKAYALSKLGRKQDSLAALAELSKQYANSRWLNDAKALEIEVKQSSGQPVSPDAEGNEELKLLALNGLMRTDPDRAFPALEKMLSGSAEPRMKERALFVAAHNRSPKTRELLVKFARGGTNPDLQARAVEYLGHQNSPETMQALDEIYGSSSDPSLRRAVLRAYRTARVKDKLLAAAKAEKTPELRREAIHGLADMDADAELWQLLQAEQSPEVRAEIVRSLPRRAESSDRLMQMARSESDPKVRMEVFRQLARTRNAKGLIELARTEKDAKMRRVLVQELSEMKSKEAQDYLVELLNK